MTQQNYDVLGIGNALLDVIATTHDDFLSAHGIPKGSMQLIEADAAEQLYAQMGPVTRISGGSAANTLAGVASFGANAAFIAKIADDKVGEIFRHDIVQAGVHFAPFLEDITADNKTIPTGRCYILVTPDGERTMQTFLGAGQRLGVRDIDEGLIARSKILYLEGYLWDMPAAKDAMVLAAHYAHKHGRKVALSLSDSFCVDRWREEFLELITSQKLDMIFANSAEIKALYQTTDFDSACVAFAQTGLIGAITKGAEGALVIEGQSRVDIKAAPIEKLVDTTGAGDLFASGFLTGFAKSLDYATCGVLGALASAEIIQHFGARPQVSLKELAEAQGVLG